MQFTMFCETFYFLIKVFELKEKSRVIWQTERDRDRERERERLKEKKRDQRYQTCWLRLFDEFNLMMNVIDVV